MNPQPILFSPQKKEKRRKGKKRGANGERERGHQKWSNQPENS
jgi:hypothetical protein